MRIEHFIKYHFPFLLLLVVIFVQSSFPALELPEIEIFSTDKLVHIGVYGLLAALCYISLIHQNSVTIACEYPLLFTLMFCSFYGFTDELHQYFVPNRDSEFYDWLADVAGIIIMMAVIRYYLSERYGLFRKPQGHKSQ